MKRIKILKRKHEVKQKVEPHVARTNQRLFLSKQFLKTCFWFFLGVILGVFFLTTSAVIVFQRFYSTTIYPNVYVSGINFGGKTTEDVLKYFQMKNANIAPSTFAFSYQDMIATVSAKDLQLGFDSNLLAQQAFDIGRSNDFLSNASIIVQAYLNEIKLPPAYTYLNDVLQTQLQPIIEKAHIASIDAQFIVVNGKVTTFRPSSNGQAVNLDQLYADVSSKIPFLLEENQPMNFLMPLPVMVIQPKITTSSVNTLGIQELIGVGTSLYQDSIPSRVYNIGLAASRINGTLIPPGQQFSFAQAVGDISSLTGYQQAYIISGGHTILGDGGGVCQVSTTLFRAALNAGIPITERHPHDYRVGYYEEDSPPGIDATVYVPTVDLKFLNDTGHYILVQAVNNPVAMRLTFYLYGTSDGRQVTMTTPVVTNQVPPPPTLFQDDPSLPAGKLQQTDFSAWGADVSFSRTVKKNGKVIIYDVFKSHYLPWQAVFLRGTGPA